MERADANQTAGLHIYAAFVMQHAGSQYVNQSGSADDLTDICCVVTCMLLGCSFLMPLVTNTG